MTTQFGTDRCSSSIAIGLAGLLLAACPTAASANDIELCEKAAANAAEGIPACTRILSQTGAKAINPDLVFVNRARGHSANGALDSAIDDYTAAINTNPKNTTALRNRGVIWFRKSEFDRAMADFNQVITLNRDNPIGYSYRGVVLVQKGEFDRAIGDFNQAIKLDGKNAETFKYRGGAYFRKRDLDRALADFNQAVRLAPKDGSVFNDRAEVFVAKGDYDRAIADYDQTIKLKPEGWRGYSSRGEAKRAKGDLDGAVADHNEALARDVKSYDAYSNRALVWKDKGEFDRAMDDLNEAILLNPNSAHALGLRGEIYRLKGDLQQSKANLDQAIKLFPQSAVLHCRRGDTLREIGTLDQSLKDYEQALMASPNALCAYVGRGLILERRDSLDAAKAEFVKATKLPLEKDVDPITGREAQTTAKQRIVLIDKALAERQGSEPPPDKRLAELEKLRKAADERAEELRGLLAAEQRRREDELAKAAGPAIDQGQRVALVIGNANYKSVGRLPNPRGDAEAVAAAFRAVGFQKVILHHDLTRQTLLAALREFETEADKADWAVIYFAGHGIEIGGVNYVIPIDANLRADRDVSDEAVPLERVMTTLTKTKKLRLIVLDACRDNPFISKMQRVFASRSIGRGLADVEPDGGILVAYAAKGGQVAFDGNAGARSPFVSAFLKHIQTPRLEIGLLFRRVRDDVLKTTDRRQEPFIYGSLPGENFYFVAK